MVSRASNFLSKFDESKFIPFGDSIDPNDGFYDDLDDLGYVLYDDDGSSSAREPKGKKVYFTETGAGGLMISNQAARDPKLISLVKKYKLEIT